MEGSLVVVVVAVEEEEEELDCLLLLWETEGICSSLAASGWRETVVCRRSSKLLTRGSIMSSTSSCSRCWRPLVWTVALWRLLSLWTLWPCRMLAERAEQRTMSGRGGSEEELFNESSGLKGGVRVFICFMGMA